MGDGLGRLTSCECVVFGVEEDKGVAELIDGLGKAQLCQLIFGISWYLDGRHITLHAGEKILFEMMCITAPLASR